MRYTHVPTSMSLPLVQREHQHLTDPGSCLVGVGIEGIHCGVPNNGVLWLPF